MPGPRSSRESSNDAMNAFSRTLAAGLMMLAFMVGGYYLDAWLGTKFFAIVGVIVGMVCSITVMLIHSKLAGLNESIKHVKPLPEEEEAKPEDGER